MHTITPPPIVVEDIQCQSLMCLSIYFGGKVLRFKQNNYIFLVGEIFSLFNTDVCYVCGCAVYIVEIGETCICDPSAVP